VKTISKLSVARYQYYYGRDYEKSLEAVEEFLEQKPQHKKALKLKGRITTILDRLPETVQAYKQALSLCKPVRDFWERTSLLDSIATAYWRLKEPELAIRYLESAVRLYEMYYRWGKEAFDEPIAMILWTLAEYQTKSGKISDAIATYEKLLENFTRGGSLFAFAEAFYELGLLYYKLNDHDKALPKFLSAAKIFESHNGYFIVGYCYYFMGCIFFVRKEFKQALALLKSSVANFDTFYAKTSDDQKAEDDRFYCRAVRLRNSLEWKGMKVIRYLHSMLLPKKTRDSSFKDNWSAFLQWLIDGE